MAPESNRTAPTLPALVLCPSGTGALRIASLSVLDRLVVALHRGGCAPIRVVSEGELPPLKASRRLGIVVEQLHERPAIAGPMLLTSVALHVQSGDVRAVIAARGRLVSGLDDPVIANRSRELHPHPTLTRPPGTLSLRPTKGEGGGEGTPSSKEKSGACLPLGWANEWRGSLEPSLAGTPAVNAVGIAAAVTDRESAAAVERRLWASLATDTDGLVDKWFNRPVGRYLSKLLIFTPITPNQVTIGSMLLGLVGAAFFARGEHWTGVIGALLLQLSALVDCVDGEVARIAFKESPIGKTLDFATDQVVHIAVFLGIAAGVSRQHLDVPALALGLSAVAGALISIPIVIRGRRVAGRTSDRQLDRFIDQASTRDFTALLIALSVVDRLHWFLWLVGITVHLFWIAALALQLRPHKGPPRDAAAA